LQNDNGWDQGQLFFTSGRVWPMPPYHAQRMASSAHLPCRVASTASSPGGDLDLTATRDEAGTTVVLKVVNAGNQAHRASIAVDGVGPLDPKAEVETLSGELDARNPLEARARVRPLASSFEGVAARFSYEFPARSYSVLRLRRR